MVRMMLYLLNHKDVNVDHSVGFHFLSTKNGCILPGEATVMVQFAHLCGHLHQHVVVHVHQVLLDPGGALVKRNRSGELLRAEVSNWTGHCETVWSPGRAHPGWLRCRRGFMVFSKSPAPKNAAQV